MSRNPTSGAGQTVWSPWKTIGLFLGIYTLDTVVQITGLVSFCAYVVYANAEAAHQVVSAQELASYVAAIAHTGNYFVVASFVNAVTVILSLVYLIQSRKGQSLLAYLRIEPISLNHAAVWVLAGLLISAIQVSCFWLFGLPHSNFWEPLYQSVQIKPLLFVAVVFIAPIIEEMLFRGFLFRGLLASRLSGWGTVIASSLAWTAVHFQYHSVYERLFIFLAGIVLGTVRLKRDSLTISILIHMGINSMPFLLVLLIG